VSIVEETFNALSNRDDIAIILINQHVSSPPRPSTPILDKSSAELKECNLPPPAQVANDIRHVLRAYTKTIPTVLEIPSKDHP
jgi:V-type H+-transporting ATPase subunit F